MSRFSGHATKIFVYTALFFIIAILLGRLEYFVFAHYISENATWQMSEASAYFISINSLVKDAFDLTRLGLFIGLAVIIFSIVRHASQIAKKENA